jgi:hypothetical protein
MVYLLDLSGWPAVYAMGPAYSFQSGRAHCVREKSMVSTYPVNLNIVLLFLFVTKSKICDSASIFHTQSLIITWET